MVNISKVLLHPYVTEKTMNYMAGTPDPGLQGRQQDRVRRPEDR